MPATTKRPPPLLIYYGAKNRLAPKYPEPKHSTIIEPFAGSAGYANLYRDRDVILIDKDERIVAAWRWLINATKRDVLALPLLEPGQDVRDVVSDYAASCVIGYWFSSGASGPAYRAKKWARDYPVKNGCWSETRRARLADQVEHISHWTIIHGTYHDAPDIEATWFVDPPYNNKAGNAYKHGAKDIDYQHLGQWCKDRKGQVIACENEGADWLPFEYLCEQVGQAKDGNKRKRSVEVVWTKDN
jgi:site-specific DNA-adenine methylase